MEVKVSLSLLVQGAGLLTPKFCDKNPKESYNKEKVLISFTKGKGKNQKEIKKLLVINTRKQKLVTQNINICEEAYDYMLSTPTSQKLAKVIKTNKNGDTIRVWDTLSVHERLKHHFDLIAHDLRAVSYSYEILDN